jgi:hypothetical protein
MAAGEEDPANVWIVPFTWMACDFIVLMEVLLSRNRTVKR